MSAVVSTRRKLGRWVGGVAATAALSVAGSFAVAAPASAALSDCPSSYTCMWKDASYVTGGYGNIYSRFANGMTNFSNFTFDWGYGPLNNNVTSVYNHGTQQSSYFYDGFTFQGAYLFGLSVGQSSANVGSANDRASSAGFSFCISNPSSYLCQ